MFDFLIIKIKWQYRKNSWHHVYYHPHITDQTTSDIYIDDKKKNQATLLTTVYSKCTCITGACIVIVPPYKACWSVTDAGKKVN